MNWWFEIISSLIAFDSHSTRSGSSFIDGPLTVFDLDTGDWDPFKMCCYTNKEGKLSLLRRNYRNEASINEAKAKLKGHNSIVSVSLIGEAKHGSVKNKDFCMYQLFINKDEKRCTVIFRNSDVLKKLPIDVYWLKNDLMKELGIQDYQLDACFNAVTLRAPFLYIYFNADWEKMKSEFNYPDEVLKESLENVLKSNNVVVKTFLNWYNKPTPNYKSLERAGRRMKELEIYKIIEPYIKGANIESI